MASPPRQLSSHSRTGKGERRFRDKEIKAGCLALEAAAEKLRCSAACRGAVQHDCCIRRTAEHATAGQALQEALLG